MSPLPLTTVIGTVSELQSNAITSGSVNISNGNGGGTTSTVIWNTFSVGAQFARMSGVQSFRNGDRVAVVGPIEGSGVLHVMNYRNLSRNTFGGESYQSQVRATQFFGVMLPCLVMILLTAILLSAPGGIDDPKAFDIVLIYGTVCVLWCVAGMLIAAHWSRLQRTVNRGWRELDAAVGRETRGTEIEPHAANAATTERKAPTLG